MQKKTFVILLISSVILIFGCASVKMASKEEDISLKNFTLPPVDKAGLYIYRNSFTGQALTKEVYVDSVLIGETANGVFFYVEITPGMHTISTQSEFSDNSLMFEAEGGKNYFAEQYIKMGVFIGGAGIEMVDEDIGKQQVLECDLAERKKF